MASPVETVLGALEAVQRTGPGRWAARCPAHDDRRPSLSVREAADGKVLLNCFGGCGALDILDALGLDWLDLWPAEEALRTYSASSRELRRQGLPRLTAADLLALLEREATVVEIIASRLIRGEDPARHMYDLEIAAARIRAVRARWKEVPR